MKLDTKSALINGLLGGFIVSLFGGWSVAVIGVVMGIVIGLSKGGQAKRSDGPKKLALEYLPTAALAAVVLILVSLFQNFILAPAIGKQPSPAWIAIPANLMGGLGMLLIATGMIALRGLPPRLEQIGKIIVLAILIIAFPFVDQVTGLRWSAQFIFALIFVILGLGLNIVVGFAGLLDLGYAAFFAIGAYTTGLLSSPQHGIYLNFWLVIWLAAGMAAIWGFILGAPTLPLRGDYLAIVTLGFGEIIPVIFKNLISVTIKEPITCWILPGILRLFGSNASITCITFMDQLDLTAGEKGIKPIGRPFLPFIGEFRSDNPITWYFLIIAIILLSVFLIRRLHNSRLGRAWMAIREDELAAAQMGI
ncbi:MAG: branched-chain amino acid ABC transporter permease, partial [Chloroflexota bacterium]